MNLTLINDINLRRFIFVYGIGAFLLLGFPLIYLHKPDLFLTLDFFKLTGLSIALCSPILIIHFCFIYFFGFIKTIKEPDPENPVTYGLLGLVALLSSYILVLLIIVLKIIFNIDKYFTFYFVAISEAFLICTVILGLAKFKTQLLNLDKVVKKYEEAIDNIDNKK